MGVRLTRLCLAIAAATSVMLAACSGNSVHAVPTTVSPDTVTYCPQAVLRKGEVFPLALCGGGGGYPGGYVKINDVNYVDGVADSSAMNLDMTYNGTYDIKVSQPDRKSVV